MGFIFPLLWSGILAIVRAIFSPFVLGAFVAFATSKLLQFVGMGLIFWQGIDVLLAFVTTQIDATLASASLPVEVYNLAAYLGLFHGISMLVAAYTLKFTRKTASIIFKK